MKKTIVIGSIISIIFLFIGVLIGKNMQGGGGDNLSAVPGISGFTCVYNSSTPSLRDGQSAAASCDDKGNLLISPSSTINIIGP